MFNNKKNQVGAEEKVIHDFAKDFIIHNMPEARRFSGQTYNNKDKSSGVGGALDNHHKTGLLIIGLGLVLISALVYFVYNFVIKPSLSSNTNSTSIQEQVTVPVGDQIVPAEPKVIESPVAEISTSTNEVSSSTELENIATSTEEALTNQTNTEPIVSVIEPIQVSVIDTDSDGLTDDEEKLIGTNSNLSDSDGDNYSDLAELVSGYDPLVIGSKLSETSVVRVSKVDEDLSLLYPSQWEETVSSANKTVVFTNSDKAFIQATYQDNTTKLDPRTWYDNKFSGLNPGESIINSSWQGFFSQDGLTAYLFSQDFSRVYTIYYTTLTDNNESLPIFHFMIKTATIK